MSEFNEIQFQVSAQLAAMRDIFVEWVQGFGGVAVIVSNVQDLWQQSSQASDKLIVYLAYNGEAPWGDFNTRALTGRVKRSWIVRLKRGRGFKAARGDTVIEFVDLVETARDMIRAMYGISADRGNDYAGIAPVRLGGQIIDCYDISFSTMNDLPDITYPETTWPTPQSVVTNTAP